MDRRNIIIIGIAAVVVIAGAFVFSQFTGGEKEPTLPPQIIIKDDGYASSTNELFVVWAIENVSDFSPTNTGIRYDTVSYATTTPTSQTYEKVKLPAEINRNGDFEIRVDFEDMETVYYRIQAAPPKGDFIWSDERSVSRPIEK